MFRGNPFPVIPERLDFIFTHLQNLFKFGFTRLFVILDSVLVSISLMQVECFFILLVNLLDPVRDEFPVEVLNIPF